MPSTPLRRAIVVVLVAVALVIGAIWVVPALTGGGPSLAPPSGGLFPSAAALATPSPSIRPSSPGSTANPPASLSPARRLAGSGSIAIVGADGSLSLVDATGRPTALSPATDASLGFPAWSPDGSRIAVVRNSAANEILVFDAQRATAGQPVNPLVIFRNSTVDPFYLAWTPDDRVSFLADDPEGQSLRVAPADGSAPLDGTGSGATIRSGHPFYFDWIERDRVLVHVGTGTDAFLGEIGLDGTPASPTLKAPGDFRSAVVSHDRLFIGYVRAGPDPAADIVVVARDGSSEHTMPVFGTAAVAFDPVGDTIAAIGPTQPADARFTIPLGPLRLLDPASGKARTLVDGSVVSFWWSPDGTTIAALRVQPVATTASLTSSTAASSAAPSPAPGATEIRLLFVDVASGKIRSQSVVQPGQLFVDQFMTYFDQYALSHRLWAPDSSSFLLPVVDRGAVTRVEVAFPNGDQPVLINGVIGFWSP
jgi:TolB protein